jgi:hypothetical protein
MSAKLTKKDIDKLREKTEKKREKFVVKDGKGNQRY